MECKFSQLFQALLWSAALDVEALESATDRKAPATVLRKWKDETTASRHGVATALRIWDESLDFKQSQELAKAMITAKVHRRLATEHGREFVFLPYSGVFYLPTVAYTA